MMIQLADSDMLAWQNSWKGRKGAAMILDQIVEDKKKRLPEHKARISESRMRALAEEAQQTAHPTFYANLKKPGLSIIGEFKKASPSLGQITSKIDLMERIEEYNASVDAISCLTEEDHFHGNVDYLKQIRAKSSLPILRKDFMIEEYQFYEAKAIGADAVLLITAILDDVQMHDFYQLARSLALDVLVETHDEAEIERAMKIDPRIIGVNNRNLKDFSITLETTKRLRPYVPKDKVFIAESGIVNDEDVAFLKACDVDGFLIGRAFMESENPKELAQRWKKIYADS
jgi:indole-3-glycerol phosphate synthase